MVGTGGGGHLGRPPDKGDAESATWSPGWEEGGKEGEREREGKRQDPPFLPPPHPTPPGCLNQILASKVLRSGWGGGFWEGADKKGAPFAPSPPREQRETRREAVQQSARKDPNGGRLGGCSVWGGSSGRRAGEAPQGRRGLKVEKESAFPGGKRGAQGAPEGPGAMDSKEICLDLPPPPEGQDPPPPRVLRYLWLLAFQ